MFSCYYALVGLDVTNKKRMLSGDLDAGTDGFEVFEIPVGLGRRRETGAPFPHNLHLTGSDDG
jgi:hypothetical protein